MRLLALLVLCVMVAMHHGAPMLGHQGSAAMPHAVGAGGHGQHGAPDQSGDHGAAIGTCLAVLVVAGLAAAVLAARRRWAPRRTASRLPAPFLLMTVGPPPHGPPRPIRPCVLQR